MMAATGNGELPKRKSALRLAMAADGTLSRSALALGLVILEHIYAADGYCGETTGDLGAEIGVDSNRWVQRLLAELLDRGYFRLERGGGRGRPNRIFIADEAPKKVVQETPFSSKKGGPGVHPLEQKGWRKTTERVADWEQKGGLGPSASLCNDYEPASQQLTKKERRKEGARSRAQESSFASGKEKAGVGANGSGPPTAIERLLQTMRREIGEAAFRAWFEPLDVVGDVNGSLTFRAPSKFHRDRVVGYFGSRLETIAGLPVEVEVAGGTPIARPPAPPPPPPPPDDPDGPDLSQLLRAMPPGDDGNGTADRQPPPPLPTQPAPTPSTRRKVSGFSRAEIAAGALDANWPPGPPAPTPDDPNGPPPSQTEE